MGENFEHSHREYQYSETEITRFRVSEIRVILFSTSVVILALWPIQYSREGEAYIIAMAFILLLSMATFAFQLLLSRIAFKKTILQTSYFISRGYLWVRSAGGRTDVSIDLNSVRDVSVGDIRKPDEVIIRIRLNSGTELIVPNLVNMDQFISELSNSVLYS